MHILEPLFVLQSLRMRQHCIDRSALATLLGCHIASGQARLDRDHLVQVVQKHQPESWRDIRRMNWGQESIEGAGKGLLGMQETWTE